MSVFIIKKFVCSHACSILTVASFKFHGTKINKLNNNFANFFQTLVRNKMPHKIFQHGCPVKKYF